MAKKIDRRVLRTRKMLSQALLALIVEREYESITIQDITERADLNRATFYLHYGTKEELLFAALEDKFDHFVEKHLRSQQGTQPLWDDEQGDVLLFEHVAENAALYKVLLGQRGMGYVISRIINYIAMVNQHEINSHIQKPDELAVEPAIVSQYFAGALFAVVSWWVQNDMPHSAEHMAHIVHKMCRTGIMPILNEQLSAAPTQISS